MSLCTEQKPQTAGPRSSAARNHCREMKFDLNLVRVGMSHDVTISFLADPKRRCSTAAGQWVDWPVTAKSTFAPVPCTPCSAASRRRMQSTQRRVAERKFQIDLASSRNILFDLDLHLCEIAASCADRDSMLVDAVSSCSATPTRLWRSVSHLATESQQRSARTSLKRYFTCRILARQPNSAVASTPSTQNA